MKTAIEAAKRVLPSFVPSALAARGTGLALAGALALTAPAMTACGGPSEYTTTGSGPAAAADAKIEVDRMEGSSSKIVKVKLTHLPPPDRIGEDLSTYVVWYSGEDGRTTRAGRLQFNPDTREGTAAFTAPFETFTVMVTAEQTEAVEGPSENVVLQQEVE